MISSLISSVRSISSVWSENPIRILDTFKGIGPTSICHCLCRFYAYYDFHDFREGITANIHSIHKASKIFGVFGTPFLQGGGGNALGYHKASHHSYQSHHSSHKTDQDLSSLPTPGSPRKAQDRMYRHCPFTETNKRIFHCEYFTFTGCKCLGSSW